MRLPPISEAPTATQIRDRVLAQLNGQARLSEVAEQRRRRVREALRRTRR